MGTSLSSGVASTNIDAPREVVSRVGVTIVGIGLSQTPAQCHPQAVEPMLAGNEPKGTHRRKCRDGCYQHRCSCGIPGQNPLHDQTPKGVSYQDGLAG